MATSMFETIQMFMGDRPKPTSLPNLADRMAQLIQNCANFMGLRTECYLQLIKQLTCNPSNESTQFGWGLIKLFMSVFSPDESFENYFEVWLRANAPKA
eukprot:838687_1